MELDQLPHTLMMVRPASFGFNEQTAPSNFFQKYDQDSEVQRKAFAEFTLMSEMLGANDISVKVFDDVAELKKPDAIFPNNWISFHETGEVFLYPMQADNRRAERRMDIVKEISTDFVVKELIDLSAYEQQNKFLEGTGSLVFDHCHHVSYACLSPRTNKDLVIEVSRKLNFEPIIFQAVDEKMQPVYHTNVVLSIGRKFVVICLDAIYNEADQDILLDKFSESGLKVVAVSYAQMSAFAGNILEVKNRDGEPTVLMSETALQSLLPGQVNAISEHADILSFKIDTIEKFGGGSVRCMLAGIHLPKRISI
jgi:hypothetical protein